MVTLCSDMDVPTIAFLIKINSKEMVKPTLKTKVITSSMVIVLFI